MPEHRPARRQVLRLLGGTLLFLPTRSFTTDSAAALTAEFRRFIDTRQVAGVVTLISRAGRDVYLKAFGLQDVERHLPMRTSTIFDMRSMTKQITAAALMCLVEDGKLHLEDPVSDYLPEFASLKVAPPGQSPRPASRPVTSLDLLTETSGMSQDRFVAHANRQVSHPLPKSVAPATLVDWRNIAITLIDPKWRSPVTTFKVNWCNRLFATIIGE
jgi:CubicO group peptidase (beta-lactamase class C family)